MPKANDFVCTLAPVSNFMASGNSGNKFYNATSWLEKRRLLGFALSLIRTHCPVGQLVKVSVVLSATKGTLIPDSNLTGDFQQRS